MKRALWRVPLLLILVIPAWQWGANVITPRYLFEYQLPPGQWCYLLSKLVAQYAFLFLTIQIVLGLLLTILSNNNTVYLDIKLHRSNGIVSLGLVILHACLFIAGAWFRSGYFPRALLSLRFEQGYYNFYVSIGIIATGMLVLVALIGILRNWLPVFVFNYGHRLAWLVWGLGFWHSFSIGTETGGWLVWSWIYLFSAVVVGLLFIYRIFLVVKQRLCI